MSMTSQIAPEWRAAQDRSRYWLLVHAGETHSVSWDDGERLLSLAAAVRRGKSKPQPFSFVPRGSSSSGEAITVFVRPDEPIELLMEYDDAVAPKQSHWFG
jgi:hypothetical protein